MIPLAQITPAAALAEFVLLADSRPPKDAPPLDRIHWDRDHLERYQALEAFLVLHPVDGQVEDAPADPATPPAPPTVPPEPAPSEAPMPQTLSQRPFEETLTLKTEAYKCTCAELVADPGCKRLRSKLSVLRYEIRNLCKRIGCAIPDLPPTPENPKTAAVVPPVVAPLPLAPATISPLAPATISPLALTPAESVARVRRDIWRLMASLEEMPKDKRAELVDEIALLDAAAHAAHGLATGKLQVG